MAFGLEITNNHGTTLIDDTYSNLAVRHQGTLAAGSGVRTVSIPGLDQPIPAVRSTAYAIALGRIGNNGQIWSAGGAQVHWYVFDTPTSGGNDYGLQVFNSAGQLTFDSSRKYARVRALQSGVGSQTYDSGRLYAVATLGSSRRRRVTSQPDPFNPLLVNWQAFDEQIAARVNGATVQTEWQTVISVSSLQPVDPAFVPLPWSDTLANSQFAVIDVTGY